MTARYAAWLANLAARDSSLAGTAALALVALAVAWMLTRFLVWVIIQWGLPPAWEDAAHKLAEPWAVMMTVGMTYGYIVYRAIALG